jgi:excinuclease UvrABC ATPase subunit
MTLAEGAVRGWDRRNVYYFQMLGSLARIAASSLEVPFAQLSAEHQGCILFGSGTGRRFQTSTTVVTSLARTGSENKLPNRRRRYHASRIHQRA